MLADTDVWTVTNWLMGAVGLIATAVGTGLSLRAYHREKLAEKDVRAAELERDNLKTHLAAIAASLESVQMNLNESHALEDVVKSSIGKRFLSSLTYQVVQVKNQAIIAYGGVVGLAYPVQSGSGAGYHTPQ
jgi:hypothetical protein